MKEKYQIAAKKASKNLNDFFTYLEIDLDDIGKKMIQMENLVEVAANRNEREVFLKCKKKNVSSGDETFGEGQIIGRGCCHHYQRMRWTAPCA